MRAVTGQSAVYLMHGRKALWLVCQLIVFNVSLGLFLFNDPECYVKNHNEWWQRTDASISQDLALSSPLNDCCAKEGSGCIPKSNSSMLRRYTGPGSNHSYIELTNLLATKNTLLIGDSMTGQWMRTISCYLHVPHRGLFKKTLSKRHELFLAEMTGSKLENGHLMESRTNDLLRHTCVTVKTGDLCIANYNETVGTLSHFSVNGLPLQSLLKIIAWVASTKDHLLVIDGGWMHKHSNTEMNETLSAIVKECTVRNAHCVLKEAHPTHFNSNFGEYAKDFTGVCNLTLAASQYHSCAVRTRNRQIWASRGHMQVLPLFDYLVPLNTLHLSAWDCLHLKLNSEIWEPVHLSLLAYLSNRTLPSSFSPTAVWNTYDMR